MATPTRIADYLDQAVTRFIQVFQDKPRLTALLASWTAEANELEGVYWSLITDRTVDRATGITLDLIGKLVGQPRVGPNDEVYRIFIKTRIRVNRSQGESIDLIEVARLLFDADNIRFVIRELYPASVIVDVIDALPAYQDFIASIFRQAKAAGVGLDLQWSSSAQDADGFMWADGTVTQDDSARGWGDSTSTVGGKWIGVS
jgi:hypothetical protein